MMDSLIRLRTRLALLIAVCAVYGWPGSSVLSLKAQLAGSAEIDEGRILVDQYCSRCHLSPPPQMLPKRKWPFVVQWMGNYLGHRNLEGELANLVMRDQIPSEPLASAAELEKILRFYSDRAPEEALPQRNKPAVEENLPLFEAQSLDLLPGGSPLVTLIHIDEENDRLFVGDGHEYQLLAFSRKGILKERHRVNSQPVSVHLEGKSFYLTLIGDLDRDRGKGQVIYYERQGQGYNLKHIIEGYYRTAHTLFYDLNLDGREDCVVSAFGDHDKGRFSWFENLGGGRYQEHILIDRSGALQAAVHDFDGDGLPDLLVLMGQGRNEIILFLNQGGGEFEPLRLIEQFPGFGYHSFELVDFNQDGHMDIVTVNGNNMEMEDPPLRNYHGIRLYLNDGNLDFSEKYFYPMYGAIKTITADFDQDGDLDIAAISFFPDWSAKNPEGFVFLENQGDGRFVPKTVKATHWGRWMTMDAGDIDGDGDLDLVLGNAFILSGMPKDSQPKFVQEFKKTPSLLLLKNTSVAD